MSGPAPALPEYKHLEAAAFLAVVGVPLVFTPFTNAPLIDGKLLLVALSALLFLTGGLRVDRRLVYAGSAFVLVTLVAAAAGLDPWWSFMGAETQGMGVVTLAACVVLLWGATTLGDILSARLPLWLFYVGVIVSAAAVAGRFVGTPGRASLGRIGSTDVLGTILVGVVGHRVFAGGIIAAAIVAAIALKPRPVVVIGAALLGSGLAVTAARSSWTGVAIGVAIGWWRLRPGWRTIGATIGVIVLSLAAWTVADLVAKPPAPETEQVGYSAVPRFTQLGEATGTERLAVWRADLRAWTDDPLLGTGLQTSWYGYLSHARPREIRTAGRNYSDAHNIVIELAATTGAAGVLAFVALAAFTILGSHRAPPDRAWAAGAAAALAVVHGFQPANIRLTPLLFLLAGVAAGGVAAPSRRIPRLVAFVAAGMLVLAGLRLGASAFEWYGTTYASETALRWSLHAEGRRLTAQIALARHEAFDHRSRERGAGARALALSRRFVAQHAWSPEVRIHAANIAAAIDDDSAAQRFIHDHLRLFPNDPLALSAASVLALRSGDRSEAARLARRALTLDSRSGTARDVLRSVDGQPPR